MRKIFTAAMLVLLPAAAFTAGGVGCDYLRVEPPARTAAMSNAFAGIADDLSAIIYNPAGLVNIHHTCFSLTHYSSFADTNYEYISFAVPIGGKWGTAGGSVLMDYTFDFEHYDEFGDKTGDVENYDFVAVVSYGYPLMQGAAIGVNIKIFYSKLLTYEKTGLAFDAGAFFALGKNPDTYAGFVIQNAGTQSAYIDVVDPMPMNVKAGIGVCFELFNKTKMLVAADVNRLLMPGQEIPTLDLGAEIELFNSICIRGGYGFRHDVANMSIGMGLNLEKVKFSYSYQPFDILGVVHRITLDIVFDD